MIEKHVTSLELSKRLKELGVKAESYFSWHPKTLGVHKSSDGEKTEYIEEFSEKEFELDATDSALWNGVPSYPAYLASELGAMLPITQPDESGDYTCNGYFSVTLDEKEGKRIWSSQYDGSGFFESESMADSMALMLIHLIEQGIINTKHRA